MVCAYIVYAQLKKSFSPSRRKKYYRNLLFPKGKGGEKRVSHLLQKLPSNHYAVLNDIILPTKNSTTQIDHIVVSIYGIFVIETKNYSGRIYGGERSEYWTQNIYGHTYQLYNPILQNEGHIRTIAQLLSAFGKLPISSIIAFHDSVDVKIESTTATIIYWSKLIQTIRNYKDIVITENDVSTIYNALRTAPTNTKVTTKQHARNVKATVHKKQTAVDSGICPRCGGKLVLRNGRYGKFWGCSNYPRCRFTRNAKKDTIRS